MILISIGVLVVIALWLMYSIVAPRSKQPPDALGSPLGSPSDYKQVRVEYHQSIDKSVSPPRH
jgi:hypothetical protein